MTVEVPDFVLPPPGLPPAPRSLEVAVTGRCNLRCSYCFYADEMAALKDLPKERWISFFGELGGLAVQRVTLCGGEPFIRPDLFDLIDGVIENKMRYSLLSNGTLIDEETIEAFDEGKRRLRLDSIQISIDGSSAEVHNKSRPPSSFEPALRGLRLLVDAGLPATVRVTVNKHNIDDLENVARLLIDDLGLPGFSTNQAQFMGSARCDGDGIMLTGDERLKAMEVLTKLNEVYEGKIGAQAGPLAVARDFAEIEERLSKKLSKNEGGMEGRGTLSSCGGVFSKMDVLHDGTMVPCNMLPALTMGVIGVNPLQEAWQRHPSINVLRWRRNIPLSSLETCRDCRYASFCTGGCPAAVMAKTGRLNAADPDSCYRIYREGYHGPL